MALQQYAVTKHIGTAKPVNIYLFAVYLLVLSATRTRYSDGGGGGKQRVMKTNERSFSSDSTANFRVIYYDYEYRFALKVSYKQQFQYIS
jgi:hypothetical protein